MRIKLLLALIVTLTSWAHGSPVDRLSSYCQMHPNDWRAAMQLCQASEAAGQRHLANLSANRLQHLWVTDTDPGLSAMDRFLRQTSPINGGRLCVYEHFSSSATHQWDVVTCDANGRPTSALIVHTSPAWTRVQRVGLDAPSHGATLRLSHRIRDYADLRRCMSELLAWSSRTELTAQSR